MVEPDPADSCRRYPFIVSLHSVLTNTEMDIVTKLNMKISSSSAAKV